MRELNIGTKPRERRRDVISVLPGGGKILTEFLGGGQNVKKLKSCRQKHKKFTIFQIQGGGNAPPQMRSLERRSTMLLSGQRHFERAATVQAPICIDQENRSNLGAICACFTTIDLRPSVNWL